MKKQLLASTCATFLLLSITSCSTPALNNNIHSKQQTQNFTDLDKEYSQFTTKTLTQSYLKKKMDKWLSDSKYTKNLVREIEYAKFKHPDLLKDIVALTPIMFDHIIADTGVNQKRIESSFETYIQYIDPYPSVVTANVATNIASTSFTANWTASTSSGVSGYKIIIDDGNPIDLGLVTSYNVAGLTASSSHTYYIKPVRNGIIGQKSNTIFVNTVAATGQFRVNSYSSSDASMAMDKNGNFVISWSGNSTGDSLGIFAQRYNSSGTKIGSEFLVNTYVTDNQTTPSLAMDENGNFVITWASENQIGYNNEIFAQKYNADGTKNGSEFQVNTYVTYGQMYPSISMNKNGNFIITWSGTGTGDDSGIFAQRYNSSGTKIGSEFKVNTYISNDQMSPSVSMSDNDTFIISWSSYGQDGGGYGIYAQRYNANGTKNGSEFPVNTYITSDQQYPSTGIDINGNFIISWMSNGQDGSGYGVYAQRYNSDGTTNGSEFRVNSFTIGNEDSPSVAMNNSGNFVISWTGYPQTGSSYGVYAQRYNSDGSKISTEFQVDSNTFTSQYPSIAMNASGNFVISWTGNSANNYGIYGKIYDSNGNVL